MYTKDEIIKENGLTLVDSWSNNETYEWAEIEVFYSKEKKRYFWIEDVGCSCNSLWDSVYTIEDMCNGSRKNAIDAVGRFVNENNGRFRKDGNVNPSKLLSE